MAVVSPVYSLPSLDSSGRTTGPLLCNQSYTPTIPSSLDTCISIDALFFLEFFQKKLHRVIISSYLVFLAMSWLSHSFSSVFVPLWWCESHALPSTPFSLACFRPLLPLSPITHTLTCITYFLEFAFPPDSNLLDLYDAMMCNFASTLFNQNFAIEL